MVSPLFAYLPVPVKTPQVPCLLFAYSKDLVSRYTTLESSVVRKFEFVCNITSGVCFQHKLKFVSHTNIKWIVSESQPNKFTTIKRSHFLFILISN